MNREDIIRMAREAGGLPDPMVFIGAYERFAALVAAAEREACAKVCDEKVEAEYATGKVDHNEMGWTQACAIAIRARGAGMNKKDEALKLALEALETVVVDVKTTPTAYEAQRQAITALRRALEQPAQQEPVAWMTHSNDMLPLFHKTRAAALNWQTQPTPLYTRPQAREPLTDEEISEIAAACGGLASDFVVSVARAIEAAHGIKGVE